MVDSNDVGDYSRLLRVDDDGVFMEVNRIGIGADGYLGDELKALPIGTGYKGGMARKIYKNWLSEWDMVDPDSSCIENELDSDGDLDVLIHVPEKPNIRGQRILKEEVIDHFSQKGLLLEYKDIEVTDNIGEYFGRRDITQNEVLVFRESKDSYGLYVSHNAENDTVSGVSVPSLGILNAGYGQNFFVKHGMLVPSPKILQRVLVRKYKGHAETIELPFGTLEHYQRYGLSPGTVFSFLKPNFLKGQDELERVVDFLGYYGLLPEGSRKPSVIWGNAYESMKRHLEREKGKHISLEEPSSADIDGWMDEQSLKHRKWCERRSAKISAGRLVTPEIDIPVRIPDDRTVYYQPKSSGFESFKRFTKQAAA